MKKTCALMAVLVLTVAVLTGCGCRNSKPANTSEPTTLPTVTTQPTTEMTTIPTTIATESTDNTIQDDNGPLSTDTATATDETGTDTARSRSGGMIGSSGMIEGAGSENGITGSITG